MNKPRRLARLAALALAGGCVFQAVGCATGFAPILLSLAESTVLSVLLGGG